MSVPLLSSTELEQEHRCATASDGYVEDLHLLSRILDRMQNAIECNNSNQNIFRTEISFTTY